MDYPFEIGDKVLLRTVTMIVTGEVERFAGDFAVLKNAAWIADTGRYSNALLSGGFSEVEPYPNGAFVNLKSLTDGTILTCELPTEQK